MFLLLTLFFFFSATPAVDGRVPEQLQADQIQVSSGELTIRYFRNGRQAGPPATLKDTLASIGAVEQTTVRQAIKEVLGKHFTANGYFSARIDSIVLADGTQAGSDPKSAGWTGRDLAVYTSPGCRYVIGSLALEVLDHDEDLLADFIPFYGEEELFDQAALQQEFRRVIRHLEKKGYALARLDVRTFRHDETTCSINLEAGVHAGNRLRAEGVMVRGLTQVDASYMQAASGIRENDIINPEMLAEGRRNLEQTGFFRGVSRGEIMIWKGDPYVHYEVVEQRANHFDLMLGYDPGTGSAKSANIVGRGEMRIRNVGWHGSRLTLMFERLDDLVTRLESGFSQDWIAGLPIGAGADFRFVQQDTSYQIRSFHLNGIYHRSSARSYSLHLHQQNTSANDHPDLPLRVLDGVTRNAGFGLRLDHTDSRFSPRRGLLFDMQLSTGFRRITDTRAEEWGSRGTMMQQQVRVSLKTYFSPFARQTLFLGFHGKAIESPEYTETDLMPLGGSRSIRGYQEEQFRVARAGWTEVEYRYLLDPLSHAFVFAAAGMYERPEMLGQENGSVAGWLYSGGFGFRYQTPIGRMQFTYAVSADDPLHNGKVHFTLVTGF
ncbi:MAG: BamA/TamA family outer membrane protein [Cyclonatronaceae bacterium]